MSDISRKLPIKINLAHALRIPGMRGLRGAPRVPASGTLREDENSADFRRGEMQTASGVVQIYHDDTPVMENDNIWRMIPRWRKGNVYTRFILPKVRAIREFLGYFGKRPLTEQELEEQKYQLELKRLDKELRLEAFRAKTIITNKLTALKFYHRTERGKVTRVQFDSVIYSTLAIYLHVDAARLPEGVRIFDLYTDSVCTDLSASLQRVVRADISKVENQVIGLTYIVERASSLGIPNEVDFSEMLRTMPADAPPLSFPVGLEENKRPVRRNLEIYPHLLIAGSTQGGKSNEINVIACTLIARTTPDEVRLMLVDLKGGGIELMHYEGVPHLIPLGDVPNGIARNVEEAKSMLAYACGQADKRLQQFTDAGCKTLEQWNKRNRIRRLPRIVIIVDELALLLDQDNAAERKETLRYIKHIASLARAAGIYMIAATQTLDKSVINISIKNNFSGRIAFSCPDYSSSELVVNDGSATNLMPVGRCVYKYGTDKRLVQAPYISNHNIRQIVLNAKAGKRTAELSASEISEEEIIAWAIDENNGVIDKRSAFMKFSGRTDQSALLVMLKGMDGKSFTHGEHSYLVKPGRGNQPRILERVDYDQNVTPVEPEPQTTPQTTKRKRGQPTP